MSLLESTSTQYRSLASCPIANELPKLLAQAEANELTERTCNRINRKLPGCPDPLQWSHPRWSGT